MEEKIAWSLQRPVTVYLDRPMTRPRSPDEQAPWCFAGTRLEFDISQILFPLTYTDDKCGDGRQEGVEIETVENEKPSKW